jgi:hypothetical protein
MKFAAACVILSAGAAMAWVAPRPDENWGEAKGGLASRLSLATAKPTLGEPMKVRLEVKNVGDAPVSYNSQQSATNNSLLIKGPDGKEIPYIGGSYQTAGQPTTLASGDTKSVYSELDVVPQYLIEKAGEYTIQSRARGGIPASQVLKITIAPGTLSDFQRLFGALHRSAPAGWRAANYSGSIVFLHTPTRLKADAASITLFVSKEPTGGPKPIRGGPAPINLGETTLGQAWLIAESQTAIDRWPEYEKVIRERIKPFLKSGVVEP